MPAPTGGVAIPAGSPEELRAGARTLAAAADALDRVAMELRAGAESATGSRRWTGPASSAFRGNLDDTQASVAGGAGACRDAAGALVTLAGELEAAQEQARDAQRAAVEATALFGAASNGLAMLTAADSPGSLGPALDPAELGQSSASLSDTSVAFRLEAERDAARADLSTAQQRGADAAERALLAGRKAAAALQAATDAAKAPPTGPDPAVPFETTGQWLERQALDVLLDPVSPLLLPLTDSNGEGNRLRLDLLIGGLAGSLDYGSRQPGGAVLSRWASLSGGAAVGLVFGTAAWDQWRQDRERADLDGGDRLARAATASVVVGAPALVGGQAGQAGGKLFGSVAGPLGPVAVVVGGAYGGSVGAAVGEKLKGSVFERLGID
jgi:hypothetical protein